MSQKRYQPRPLSRFPVAEVAIRRELFTGILHLIAELQPPPDPSRLDGPVAVRISENRGTMT